MNSGQCGGLNCVAHLQIKRRAGVPTKIHELTLGHVVESVETGAARLVPSGLEVRAGELEADKASGNVGQAVNTRHRGPVELSRGGKIDGDKVERSGSKVGERNGGDQVSDKSGAGIDVIE